MPKRKASKWGVYVMPPWGLKERIGSVRARTEEKAMVVAARKFSGHIYPLEVALLIK